MLIKEACQAAGLSRKAVEYYEEQGLVAPVILENGYRDFSGEDVARLEKIGVLRRLGLSVAEIRGLLDAVDPAGEKRLLRDFRAEREEGLAAEGERLALMQKLEEGADWRDVAPAVQAMECKRSILERLRNVFPGPIGQSFTLHFGAFLDEPIGTAEQQAAFERIIELLDDMPPFSPPPELQGFLDEMSAALDNLPDTRRAVEASIADMDGYMEENRDFLDSYLAFRQTEEYRKSPFKQYKDLMRQYQYDHGYIQELLPALRALSPSYDAYARQMESANEALLRAYPGFEEME